MGPRRGAGDLRGLLSPNKAANHSPALPPCTSAGRRPNHRDRLGSGVLRLRRRPAGVCLATHKNTPPICGLISLTRPTGVLRPVSTLQPLMMRCDARKTNISHSYFYFIPPSLHMLRIVCCSLKKHFFCVCIIAQHELWRGIKTPAQQTLACPAPLYCCLDELLSLECLALPSRPSGNPGAVAKLTEK